LIASDGYSILFLERRRWTYLWSIILQLFQLLTLEAGTALVFAGWAVANVDDEKYDSIYQ
jgi:hypothetical protein